MSIDDQVNIENTTAIFHKHKFIHNHLIEIGIEEVINSSSILNIDLAIEVVIKLCTTPYSPIDSLLSSLRNYNNLPLQEIADTISLMVNEGLLSYNHPKISSVYQIPEDIKIKLNAFSYPLPLVIEPRTLNTNTDSAYYTKEHSYSNVTNIPSNIIDLIDINLDHLNHVNKTPLILYKLDSFPDIPNIKEGESQVDYNKKLTALSKYVDVSTDINTLLEDYETIYLTHYYDKRGRIYCKGYHLTYQGTDWNKAIIHIKG